MTGLLSVICEAVVAAERTELEAMAIAAHGMLTAAEIEEFLPQRPFPTMTVPNEVMRLHARLAETRASLALLTQHNMLLRSGLAALQREQAVLRTRIRTLEEESVPPWNTPADPAPAPAAVSTASASALPEGAYVKLCHDTGQRLTGRP